MNFKRYMVKGSGLLITCSALAFGFETAFDRLPPVPDFTKLGPIPTVQIPAAALHEDPAVPGEKEYINAIIPRVRALVIGINLRRKAALEALKKAGAPVKPSEEWVVRDAHGKANACVRATFKTVAGLAPEYLQGVLKVATHGIPAVIRLSNGATENDLVPDGHGFAMKLLVDAAKGITEDRIFINHRNFFSTDQEYGLFAQASLGGLKGIKAFFTAPQRIAHEGLTSVLIAHPIASPLNETYWSMTPYWDRPKNEPGKQLAKYSVTPCADQNIVKEAEVLFHKIEAKVAQKVGKDFLNIKDTKLSDIHLKFPTWDDLVNLSKEFSPDELWDRLEKLQTEIGALVRAGDKDLADLKDYLTKITQWQLAQSGACFEYQVQIQADAVRQPVDNALVEWSEKISKFKTVAHIEIPMQTFGSEAQQKACEDLTMTPAHGGKAAGLMNRIREAVYADISGVRHIANKTQAAEPKSNEGFASLLAAPSRNVMMENSF